MKTKGKIRVLIVEDSLLFQQLIQTAIEQEETLEVVGIANNPLEAQDKMNKLNPDVMTLDIEMPRMDGITFLKQAMPQHPLPVVVVSSISEKVFDALQAGAVDFVAKPTVGGQAEMNQFFNNLIVSIKIASIAKLKNINFSSSYGNKNDLKHVAKKQEYVIAIGASTGGTDAIYEVIRCFNKNTPGVVIVQHMPPVFTKMYAERLNRMCEMEVKEAEEGDRIQQGRILIAPGGYHMKVIKDARGYGIRLFEGEKVNGHCPSVDVLFDSMAKIVGEDGIGIILTGMGMDGAKGLVAMRGKGAMTFGQDEESCIVYGMPMVAFNMGAVVKQLSLLQIGQGVLEFINERTKKFR